MGQLGVYCIENTDNGKVYIGSSRRLRKRWIDHTSMLRANKHHNTHLQSAWNKYGEGRFVFRVLEEVACVDDLIGREVAYVLKYDSCNRDRGYNGAMPDEVNEKWTTVGKIVSEERRRQVSEQFKGKPLSPEHRQKIAKANTGKPGSMKGKTLSEERKHKIRQASTNISDETRRKRSEAAKRQWERLKADPQKMAEKIQQMSESGTLMATEEWRKAQSERLKAYYAKHRHPWTGQPRTEEHCRQLSESIKRSYADRMPK